MTENEIKESKEWLQDFTRMFGCNFDDLETRSFNKIVTYLEEIQQYRAIGTVEEFKALKVENEELHCEIQAINATMDLLENEIRAKAIDEFAEKLSLEVSESIIWDMLATMSKNSSLSDTSDEIVDYVINTANEIAERLKVGGENG